MDAPGSRFALLDHLPIPAYVFEREGGEHRLRYVNGRARAENPGIADFLGVSMTPLYRDQPEILADADRAMAERHVITRDLVLRRHDQTVAALDLRLWFIPLDADHLLIASQVATAETSAEVARRESEGRYRGLLASLPDAVIMRGADGRIVGCNDVAARMLGAQHAVEVIGRSRMLTGDLQFRTEAGTLLTETELPGRRVLVTGRRITGEVYELISGGTVRWLRVSAEPIVTNGVVTGSVTLLADVTDRVQSERTARAAVARLDLALSASRMGVWEYDVTADTGWWSPNLPAVFGFDGALAPGLAPFVAMVHPDDRAPVIAMATDFRDGRKHGSFELAFRLIGDDGVTRWAWVQGRQVDRPGHLAGTVKDITEQRHLEEELRRASRLESIGRLAGGVAHDFNNLLAAMVGSLELIDERCGDDLREDVATIGHALTRARDLTKQLLAFARKQPVAFRKVELGALVVTVERLVRRLVGPRIEIAIESQGQVVVDADPSSLEQVLVNLVVNARDAMPDGGRLLVRTATAVVTVDGQPVRRAALEVIDSGVGMDEATRAQIFDPFFTTKSSGTGLGLASSYGIIRQHDGDIVVESERGRGTTFRVLLPLHDGEVAREPAAAPITTPPPIAAWVLVVDDEDLVRATSARVVKSLGYQVLTAGGADEALAVAAAHPGPIDFLLCDVAMPVRDGPSLAAELRTIRPELQTLFVSGYADEAAHVAIEGAAFLAKPFKRAELQAKLDALAQARPKVTVG